MIQRVILCIGVFIILLYLILPVPYCKILNENGSTNEEIYVVKTEEEIEETSNQEILFLKTKGTSMLPAIKNNSSCVCLKQKEYFVGDIVFFFVKLNDNWTGVSHRIFLIEWDQVSTKGDNNDWIDSPIKKENIICAIPDVPRYFTYKN